MSEQLEMSVELPVTPKLLYKAWLDSRTHSQFTGSPAEIDARVGGEYSAWEGYIYGKTLALEPDHLIRQSWRTTEFPQQAPDSVLEVLIEPVKNGARLTLRHSQIPDGQKQMYTEGWQDYYFTPMQAYFSKSD
jgi:activator of HSP90 ATPase